MTPKLLESITDPMLAKTILVGYNAIFCESVSYPNGFDIKEFGAIRSFKQRVQYANDRLQKLGQGSSRIAYKIDDNTVLKIAKNNKGLEQNRVEGDWGLHDIYSGLLPQLIDMDEENLWIIVQKANKITPKEFQQMTGIPFDEFNIALREEDRKRNGRKSYYTPKYAEEILDDEFFQEVTEMCINYDLEVSDMAAIGNWGKVDTKENPVVVDAGLSKSVYRELYDKRR